MFQLSETEEKGGEKIQSQYKSNNKEKAEHREIQMWEREKKKAEGWRDDQTTSQYEQNS